MTDHGGCLTGRAYRSSSAPILLYHRMHVILFALSELPFELFLATGKVLLFTDVEFGAGTLNILPDIGRACHDMGGSMQKQLKP